MASQTGSIDLTASNSVKLAAEAGWQGDLNNYYRKSEIDLTVEGIETDVTEIVDGLTQSSHFTQTATGFSFTLDDALDDAAKTATNYATDITGGGVMVHPSDDATSGVRITSDVDIMRDGTSVINIGTNDAVRIGAADNVQMLLASDGMEIDNEVGTTIFAVESNSTGTTTVTVTATAATWAAETDVGTTTYTVSDESAASGYAVVTATIADTDYTLDSTYATATVTAGTGASVALTSPDGVDYVQSLMSDAGVTTGTLSIEYQRTVADSASLTFDGSQVVNGSGHAIALFNGVSGTETFFDAHNTVTNARVLFGVGVGGYNRGIWDEAAKSWVIYRTQSGKTVIGGPNFSVDANGLVKIGRKVVAAGNKRVALAASVASGSTNRGLWDETGGAWIIYRSTGGSIVLGDSVSDVLYHRESTCSAKTANATFYNNFNFCWNNGACCTIQLCVNLKSNLANGNMVDVAEAPSGYRPPHVVFGSVMVTGQNVNLQAEVLADGTIRVNNRSGTTVTSSANIYISFTFAL